MDYFDYIKHQHCPYNCGRVGKIDSHLASKGSFLEYFSLEHQEPPSCPKMPLKCLKCGESEMVVGQMLKHQCFI